MNWDRLFLAPLCGVLCAASLATPARAVPVEIRYSNADGAGFFAPEIGSRRRTAFEFAVDQWARTLAGDVPIVVDAAMVPLGGAGADALLASAGAVTIHRNFGSGQPNTWYGAALANQLAGADLNGPELPEISVTFNEDVDGPEVLGSVAWYYGLDAQPGADIDLITIALHEIGHGLGFFESVDPTNGGWRSGGDPGIFDRMLLRPGVGGFAEILTAERLSAIVSGGRLLWGGPFVFAAGDTQVPVFAPDPFALGSSIAHWDTSLSPDELMEPSYTVPNHDPGLLLPALVDMGWNLAVASFTPGPPMRTPTPSATPSPSFTPPALGEGFPQVILVTNFDSATVSVIEGTPNRVTSTIPVGDGPIGIVVSSDGAIAYVASFHSATVSVISTIERRVIDTIPVQGSANSLALTPDGSLLFVTDTFTETVSVIGTAARTVFHTVPAPPQPAGVAAGSDGSAFVTNFGGNAVSVIDPGLGEVVAKIVLDELDARGPLGITIPPDRDIAYVTTAYSSELFRFDTLQLERDRGDRIFPGPAEAIVLAPDAAVAYLAATDTETGNGVVRVVDLSTSEVVRSIRVGNDPEALALTPDGARVYIAVTGSDTVAFFNTQGFSLVGSIPVGAAPMGVAIARIAFTPTSTPTATITPTPLADCAGDCDGSRVVTVAELISGVNIALGTLALDDCRNLDADAGQQVTVDELVRATRNALVGCP